VIVTETRLGPSVALLLILSACTTPPPPVTSLAGRACAAAPDLAAARPLTLDDSDGVTVALDATAACFTPPDGGQSAYLVFRLPDASEAYLLSVKSDLLGQTLFAPRLMTLSGDGSKLREVRRDAFTFHGASLYAGLRARPEERYLVVLSDTSVVGADESQVVPSVQSTTMVSGPVVFTLYSGAEATRHITYAHNGKVTVVAQKMPKAQ
jgi:hypothetical protein